MGPARPCDKIGRLVVVLAADLMPHSAGRLPSHRALRFHLHANHGCWLNIIEGFFSKLEPLVLRHICVNSKDELKHG